MVQNPANPWEARSELTKKKNVVGGMRGSGRRCCRPLPPERIAHVDGAPTPGFETGSVGRDGQECDLIVATSDQRHPLGTGRRVETEAGWGKGRRAWSSAGSSLGHVVGPGVRMLRGALPPFPEH